MLPKGAGGFLVLSKAWLDLHGLDVEASAAMVSAASRGQFNCEMGIVDFGFDRPLNTRGAGSAGVTGPDTSVVVVSMNLKILSIHNPQSEIRN